MLAARDWFGDASVFVVDVPLACCALETQTAAQGRFAVDAAAIPEGAKTVVALSGTITEPVVPAIRHVLDQVPGATVVAFGACACIGGPYWDSYSVVKGAGDVVPVDRFIAGCPPPPSAINDFLEEVRSGAVA
ncbi:MAG TPA: proton-conducting membrane transporter [Tessaracoccus flavescens]|uniref:Proton-conducting membrane transporter n=1 Tax=Tessaracoccus flavescens TaxID=399497 RepID=A0A921EQV6_9ACTN|nr:proton-conducting membrane transporter [Tessaracoccus flavescens]